jgi:signal transduction histidine kinase/CheY-like chemotaxis protein
MKRKLFCILMTLVLSGFVFSCKTKEKTEREFTSFLDIPGITHQEILAIESLKVQKDHFVYGMTQGPETFERYGIINGFSAMVCEWLTQLFNIPFIPAIYEKEELLRGLQDGSIDFTGDITPEAEADNYFMTSAIALRNVNDAEHLYRPVSLSTQNPQLEAVITIVQKSLPAGTLTYLTKLHTLGYKEYLEHSLYTQLTNEERIYLNSAQEISFASEYDNYPLCFYNVNEKQWQGIAFDIIKELEHLTGLKFNLVNKRNERINWNTLLKMLESGEIAMLPQLIRTEDRIGRFLWPESTIISDNYALLSKLEYPNISPSEILSVRIGLPKGTAYTETFKHWFPYHEFTTEYESSFAALSALDKGDVDMIMSSKYRFMLLTHFLERPGYKANVIFDKEFDSTFGFNLNETVLCSIIEKSFAYIDIDGIADKWLYKTFFYQAKQMRTNLIFIVIAFSVVFFLCFFIVNYYKNRRHSMELEDTVFERTNELKESKAELVKALDMAKAASDSKSMFLAKMSHEIRTPMNSIVGFSELADNDELPEVTKDYLAKIRANADWMMQIVNDILDISKIEAGMIELENIPFDMHDLFVNCRTIIMPKAEEKGIMLHFYAEPSIGKKPMGDPLRLRQVFINLLSNAVKFTNSGIVKLYAGIIEKTDKTITMQFEIKDSGIGMTKEQVENLFEPFNQSDPKDRKKASGTGLGLTISKSIIEKMGGVITVESNPGLGTKFHFELTFDTVDDNDMFDQKLIMHEFDMPTFEGEILLCEDNEMNQQVICEHLSRVGLKTTVAENGKVGVQMVEDRINNGEKMFDLVFMDIHMPVMDGLEAAGEISKLDGDLPIVAMTANIMSNDKEIYRMNGMTDCVNKPFTSQELWKCLIKYFMPQEKKDGYNSNE